MRAYSLIPVTVAGALLYAACDGEQGIRKWWQLRSELARAERRIAGLESEVARLRQQAAELEADGFAVERAIREDLRFARRDEMVVRLPPERPPRFGGAENGAGGRRGEEP